MPPVELLRFAPAGDPSSEVVVEHGTSGLVLTITDATSEQAKVRLSAVDAERIRRALTLKS